MGKPEYEGACENCGHTTRYAFQVSHAQTATHWRCASCFRDLVDNGRGVLVTGYTTKVVGLCRTDRATTKRAVNAAYAILCPDDPDKMRKHPGDDEPKDRARRVAGEG